MASTEARPPKAPWRMLIKGTASQQLRESASRRSHDPHIAPFFSQPLNIPLIYLTCLIWPFSWRWALLCVANSMKLTSRSLALEFDSASRLWVFFLDALKPPHLSEIDILSLAGARGQSQGRRESEESCRKGRTGKLHLV